VRTTNGNARNILLLKFEHELIFKVITKAMNR